MIFVHIIFYSKFIDFSPLGMKFSDKDHIKHYVKIEITKIRACQFNREHSQTRYAK